ncbi:hypothetical protein M2272_005627 [Mycobacterium frederiksbergense]|uniref:Uncharacterized protein n=1 Tax=Mycolicibacterium frederiksbergense TaxID=117567 RepID=A0ABT6L7W3_9MYCO|nr:hypothetical protein [Mycolicibacterium frederiksbergense]
MHQTLRVDRCKREPYVLVTPYRFLFGLEGDNAFYDLVRKLLRSHGVAV